MGKKDEPTFLSILTGIRKTIDNLVGDPDCGLSSTELDCLNSSASDLLEIEKELSKKVTRTTHEEYAMDIAGILIENHADFHLSFQEDGTVNFLTDAGNWIPVYKRLQEREERKKRRVGV